MPRRTQLICKAVVIVAVASACAALAPAPAAERAKPQAAERDSGAPGGNALPTVDEIHLLFRDQNYKETLQKLGRVLALKGDAAKGYDRHDLLRLRAETQLKLKDVTGAINTFEQAAKEAPDDRARAVDLATQMVLKRSKNLTFTRSAKRNAKGAAAAKADPVDVSEPEKRKAAFEVLLAEQKDEVSPKLKAAKDARALPPIIEALQAAGGLRTLELAATGEDAQVKAMVQGLTDRARKLMADAIQDWADAVAQIEASANRLTETFAPMRQPGIGVYAERSYKKKGLMTRDLQDLKRVIADCKKLVPTARELGEKLGDAGEPFRQVAKDAAEVGNKAHEVLTADYGSSYTRSRRSAQERRQP